MENKADLPIISSIQNLKFLSGPLSEEKIIDLLSDIKHRVFPRPFERLSSLRDSSPSGGAGLTGIEIGVAGGEHALSILKTLQISRLYLIDPYEMYESYTEGANHYGIDQKPLRDTEKIARELLEPYSEKLVWVKNFSSEAVNEIKELVDFVYIDGNHQLEFVTEDIENYFPLVRDGGVIGGHDFYNGFQREHDGVVNSVTSFAIKNSLTLRVEMPDWWIEKITQR
jgi:hypothetical protein